MSNLVDKTKTEMTHAELQQELRNCALPVTGYKLLLVERLIAALFEEGKDPGKHLFMCTPAKRMGGRPLKTSIIKTTTTTTMAKTSRP